MKPRLLILVAATAFRLEAAPDDDAHGLKAQGTHEDLGPNHSMVEMAATFSIDYEALLAGCLQSDNLNKRRKSMSVMLWLSAFGRFGGEYGEEHAGRIGSIMTRIGDDSMAQLVANQPKVLRLAAAREVAYAFALYEPDSSAEEVEAFAKKFPKTFRVLDIGSVVDKENARGADQPATAPESKAQDDQKSKPESEVRPQ